MQSSDRGRPNDLGNDKGLHDQADTTLFCLHARFWQMAITNPAASEDTLTDWKLWFSLVDLRISLQYVKYPLQCWMRSWVAEVHRYLRLYSNVQFVEQSSQETWGCFEPLEHSSHHSFLRLSRKILRFGRGFVLTHGSTETPVDFKDSEFIQGGSPSVRESFVRDDLVFFWRCNLAPVPGKGQNKSAASQSQNISYKVSSCAVSARYLL